jgi:predicted ATP-grasp superfamily ATP-dependent carboligase
MPNADRFPHCFLLVAHSARLLAQSAARARHPVCTLDLFNDADTGRFALASEAVDARAGNVPGFDRDDLLRRAARLCPPQRCRGLVYGAGFEDDTGTLALLAEGRELLGNPPELVARLKDPAAFFGLLDRLAIAHPKTVLTRPEARRGWLYKRRGATGGAHVVDAAEADCDPADGEGYFQRRVSGRNLSVLFLADGRCAEVVAISRQLTRGSPSRRYAYAGAVGPIDVPAVVSRTLRDALQALVAHTGLVGCNSVDFLLDGETLTVLEINPRPSATMDLYDDDWPEGLFDAHLKACRGLLPAQSPAPRSGPVRAHAIVYAGAGLRIAPDTVFPAWCSDIPQPGSRVAIEAPVCTVHANGPDVSAALGQLGRRRRRTELGLTTRLDSEETRNECSNSAPKRESQCGPDGRIAAGTPQRASAGRAPA